MITTIKICKGRDLNLPGKPSSAAPVVKSSSSVAVLPVEYPGVKPKLHVSEGDAVRIGSCLFADKAIPEMRFLSPGAGRVKAIVRGDKRVIERIVISLDEREESETFNSHSADAISSLGREAVIELLLHGGLWPCLKARPFALIAQPSDQPQAIFVNGVNAEPLASHTDIQMQGEGDYLRAGIRVLSRLTDGKVYLCARPDDFKNIEAFRSVDDASCYGFEGHFPSGTSSAHIQEIEPLRKNQKIWTLRASEAALIGRLFLDGKYPIERVMAVAGPAVKDARHIRTRLGASLADLLRDEIADGENVRVISGSVLTGRINAPDGFSSFYKPDVTVIPDEAPRCFMGWACPGHRSFSFSRSFLSTWFPAKQPMINTSVNGGLRAIVATDAYDQYVPVDVLVSPLIKACLAEDVEQMERLGLLDCEPEDFAMAGFVCPSKLDICGIVRKGLDLVQKDLA